MKKFERLYTKLRNRLFLSSMMGITYGHYCSVRSKGCVMVQLGAYLAEPPSYGIEKYFLPPTPQECISFLREENKRAKRTSQVFTCLNLATPRLEWGLEAAECFHEGGGDLVELNVHGSYEPYLRLGKLRAMVLPGNRSELYEWIEEFTKLDIPIIIKFREGVIDDYSPVLKEIAKFNIFGIHFNIRNEKNKEPNYEFVRSVKRKHQTFLLVSGYVRSASDTMRLFKAGADLVGIAEPTIKDPNYIQRITYNINS